MSELIKKRHLNLRRCNVVAVIDTIRKARHVSTVWPTEADVVEIRVDKLCKKKALRILDEELQHAMVALIITVRDKSEGGARSLSVDERKALYRRFLKYASAIDIETKLMDKFRDVISEARKMGVIVIGSHHDFEGVPYEERIQEQYERANKYGASVFKLAVTAKASDFPMLTRVFLRLPKVCRRKLRLSFMSMGETSKMSRLYFAGLGSALNYGSTGKARERHYWPARELRQIVRSL
jgi:3-dehydroquinate dehydratase-1